MSLATQTKKQDVDYFKQELNRYKEVIDARINSYMKTFDVSTNEQFGVYPYEATKTFSSYMSRGGKRIRGALVMLGYEMFGGKNSAMIIDAALSIEMLQSYILMMDDIQDRSETRRGGPTAHIMLKDYHEKHHLRDDSLHFGESIAMNAYLVGCHAALDLIASLDARPSLVLKALRNIHRCYMTTGHGQTLDIFNEVVDTLSENDVDNVLIWKTAFYTFVNPLQFGAILAGAGSKELDALYEYSLPAGRAFQITDDILGVFGNEFESGKSPLDDIREGKRTVLAVKALELADKPQSYFLKQCLGKHDLTAAEFKECQHIIKDSGALNYAKQSADEAVVKAVEALNDCKKVSGPKQIKFLRGLVYYLLERKA